MAATNFIIPVMLAGILVYGLAKGVNVFEVFVEGAKEGIQVTLRVLPPLVGLLTAIGMLRASGALDVLTYALSGAVQWLGVPEEVLPLALVRPVSGSGAMAVYSEIISRFGPDGRIGRVASVLFGSTETTFYTIAVYFGATQVTKTRHTLPAALSADLTGLLMSAVAVTAIFGR